MDAKQIRLATETATGNRYIVVALDFRANVAHCRGELVSYTGLRTRHAAERSFPLDAVQIADASKTPALVEALYQQARRAANAGQLPGYLSDAEAREQARAKRAAKADARRVIGAAYAGDLAPLYDLLDRHVAGAAKCGMGCGHAATTKIEGVYVCASCAAELA
jgi:hypothetical protein